MLDLSNIFNKDIKKAILSKEQLAEMLKVTPEALEAFERSYQLHSMNDSTISDNLFKVNAKQAAVTKHLTKIMRGKESMRNNAGCIEEMADVQICLNTLQLYLDLSESDFNYAIDVKLERYEGRR